MPEHVLVQNLSSIADPSAEIRSLSGLAPDTEIQQFKRRYLRSLLFSPIRLWRMLRASPPDRHIVFLDRIYPRAHPFRTSVTALLQNAGGRYLLDRHGHIEPIRWRDAVCRDLVGRIFVRYERNRLVAAAKNALRAMLATTRKAPCFDSKKGSVLYTLCDPLPGYVAGGLGAHAAGIIGGLQCNGMTISFVAIDRFEPVESLGCETHIAPWNSYAEAAECTVGANFAVRRKGAQLLSRKTFSCIYQRSGLHAFGGALLAQEMNLPLVLEYNGSEAWVARNWGNGEAALPELSKLASQATEHLADLIVVVSEPLRHELIERGICAEKILVQPNAADTQTFRPDISGRDLRAKLFGDSDGVIIGFFGTFGKWHGTEVLAKAAAIAAKTHPGLRWLFVGDGLMAAETKRIIEAAGLSASTRFTGMIAHKDAPEHLAACDILVSPTLPNTDGSAFFGSPTKLFEYMAMGRAIIVSRVGQLAQIIEHDRTGVIVEPGDPRALAIELCKLSDDPLGRERLGKNAREQCERKHTWIQAASNILAALKERCPCE